MMTHTIALNHSLRVRPAVRRVLLLTAVLWLASGCAASPDPRQEGGIAAPAHSSPAALSLDTGVTKVEPPRAEMPPPRAVRGAAMGAGQRAERMAGRSAGADRMRVDDAGAPVDAATIDRLLHEAEDAYAAARWGQALEAFKAVTTFDARNRQAWLRIGNLHQRRGHLLAAASAYRRAGQPGADNDDAARVEDGAGASLTGTSEASVRAKALLNLALVNLELAEAALNEAASLSPDDRVVVTTNAAQAQAQAALTPVDAALVAQQAGLLARRQRIADRLERIAGGVSGGPRIESVGASAAPDNSSAVEYLRGAPAP